MSVRRSHSLFGSLALLLVGLLMTPPLRADWRDDIGWTALKAELGDLLEDGAGLAVSQVEAPRSGAYMADTELAEFLGKTWIDGTGTNVGSSSHATTVARNFFSRTNSIAPGITQITGYDANDYLNRVLGYEGGADPLTQAFAIGNHSYVGNIADKAVAQDILERFDFVINRDNAVMTVGVNNGSGKRTPDLLAHSYNAIAVGRTSGDHSRGATTFYGAGRFKPDIVAGDSLTSYTTPRVAGAAAILRQAAEGTAASDAVVLRSLLFAGATKDEFADWSRTSVQPIDEVYGFGELNIYNSYHILQGGEFEGSTDLGGNSVGRRGWHHGQTNGTQDVYYEFELSSESPLEELSVALTWNINVIDNDPSVDIFNASTELANLDLALLDSQGNVIDESVSLVNNSEHLFLRELAAGSYRFRVSSDSGAQFGLAWQITTVPEPSTGWLACLLGGLYAARRQRKRF
ncbi:MAG: PEP-CTERM sorting domain-containing protein [Planctomycetota bacterium]|nr:PEP-CTERM sorting domain-containing protein [Planctomycetota bacterium]